MRRLLLAALLFATGQAGAIELRNDGFESGNAVAFQGGFTAGEMVAATLVSPCTPAGLLSVRLLYGGAGGTRTITLHVYDDTAVTTSPGTQLHEADYLLTASDTDFNDIGLVGDNVTVPARFRVAIQFQDDGLPSVARDQDGTITADRNFVYTGGQWFQSSTFLIPTDWIIRAEVVCDRLFANDFE